MLSRKKIQTSGMGVATKLVVDSVVFNVGLNWCPQIIDDVF